MTGRNILFKLMISVGPGHNAWMHTSLSQRHSPRKRTSFLNKLLKRTEVILYTYYSSRNRISFLNKLL